MAIGKDEIESRFGTHKATVEGPEATMPKHKELRRRAVEFMTYLDEVLPDSREKSEAFTNFETGSMYAHKAIAKAAPLLEE
jgi:hypothetical protein